MSAVLTDILKNACLDSAVAGAPGTALFLGLHTTLGQSGTEVTGGSPAYGRMGITWQAAGAVTQGTKDITAAVTFNVPAGTTVRGIGLWSASTAGTLRAWGPAGASARRSFSMDAGDLAGDVLTSAAHGLVN